MSDDISVDWQCSGCGRHEHDAMLTEGEDVEIDVTCRSVYFTFNDDSGDPGMVFDHSEFDTIIGHYNRSLGRTEDPDAVDIAVRAYEMYKRGDLTEEQAVELFADQKEKVDQMLRCDEILRNQPEPDIDDEELFFDGVLDDE